MPFALFGPTHTVSRLVSAAASLVGLLLFYRLGRRLAGPVAAWWSILTVRHPLDGGAGGSPASDGALPDRTPAGLVRICEWSVAAGGGHGCDNRVAAPDQSKCDLSSPGVGAGGVVARPLAVSSPRSDRSQQPLPAAARRVSWRRVCESSESGTRASIPAG